MHKKRTTTRREPQKPTTFREALERKITDHAVRQVALRTAPSEVIHRRVDGVTVVSRRFHRAS
jgi:hypothetical protein